LKLRRTFGRYLLVGIILGLRQFSSRLKKYQQRNIFYQKIIIFFKNHTQWQATGYASFPNRKGVQPVEGVRSQGTDLA